MIEDMLAAWRLTRLITEDEITRPARERIVARLVDRRHPRIAYLFSCPHCVGVYVSMAIGAVEMVAPSVWRRLRRPLAIAGAVSLIADVVDP